MVFITAIHLAGGTGHEHIERVRWLNCDDSKSNVMTVAQAVDLLRRSSTRLYVATSGDPVDVGLVEASPPYIRSVANGVGTDNLLQLPRF